MVRPHTLLFVCAKLLTVTAIFTLYREEAACVADEVQPNRPWHAEPARLYELRGRDRRLLDTFERFLDQGQWEDAFDTVDRLLQRDVREVVSVNDQTYVSLRQYCHRQLAKLPPDAIRHYRELIDPLAESWYQQGIAERDWQLLSSVLDKAFCSSWGDDALLALGELALEQGHYQSARLHWGRIRTDSQEPIRESMLVYPDSDISLADVKARLALVSLYEGNLERAEREIQQLVEKHAEARGRLGGREVVYANQLHELLQQAKSWPPRPLSEDWPTFSGSATRTNAIRESRPAGYIKLWSHPLTETPDNQLSTYPIVVGEMVVYQNGSQVQALQLATGERLFTSQLTTPQRSSQLEEVLGRESYLLTGNGHRLLGTMLPPVGARHTARRLLDPAELWGIDLKRDGAIEFQKKPEDVATIFAGPPVVEGDRMWVSLWANDRTARVGVVCCDLATHEQVWQTWICQSNTPATGSTNELITNLLTYDSGMLYSCTNLGAIAAIRADDGEPMWVTSYDRTSELVADSERFHYYREPNPCAFYRGMLFALPTDSADLLALEAATGEVVWRRRMSSSNGLILGVAKGRVVVSDDGLQTLDARTGETLIHKRGFQLLGKPVVVGGTIYWPSDQTIEAIDIATGDAIRATLELPESGGANLLAAGACLLAAGPSQLTVYRANDDLTEPEQVSPVP